MARLAIGSTAPDFSFDDDTGLPHRLTDYRGSPVILVFPRQSSRAAQPRVQQLTFGGERVPVLAPEGQHISAKYRSQDELAVFVVSEIGTIAWRHLPDDEGNRPPPAGSLTRREFIAAMLAASVAATLGSTVPASASPASAADGSQTVDVSFLVNGRNAHLSLDPRVTLLDALRERLRLTGTKKGCDHGQCGACTVHVDGRRVLSCLTLAASVRGKSITTIEGLADGDRLHPMQNAFIEHDGFQCGYCTAGQLMSAVALLREPCGPDDDDVREVMSGNICRCGAYPGIVAAIQAVRRKS